ncbi:MAG: CDGSH iron-sulfur domain-containing protein [Casimicrobiaceae bacterium]
MPEDKVHRYESSEANVTWDAARCIHAAECVRGLPAVFDPAAKPWIRPESAAADSLAAVINRCPSGALQMHYADGTSAMDVPAENAGTVTPSGPNYLRGKLTFQAADGALDDTRMALCRCGASQHKPFCDNSHRKIGFADAGALPAAVAAPPGTDHAAPLTIRGNPNGPIVCTGPLTLHGSDGRTAFAETTFLCRCGGSHNKPYCDGTHKKIGFAS